MEKRLRHVVPYLLPVQETGGVEAPISPDGGRKEAL
jgi:hypothetical protein